MKPNKLTMTMEQEGYANTLECTGVFNIEEMESAFLQFMWGCGFSYVSEVNIVKRGEE